MIVAGDTPAALRERLLHIANQSYGYMLPRDLYIHSRSREEE